MTDDPARLTVQNLAVDLGGRRIVDRVSFDCRPGEIVGLVGPNGAGKSTLLRAIAGLVPSGGSFLIDGEDARALSPRQRARRLAYIAQEREIAWGVAVLRLVAIGREPHRGPFAGLTREDESHIAAAMALADVAHLAHRSALSLSGGERARVLIARALAQASPLIVADEPTAGLDPAHQIGLMETFAARCASGDSVLASLHDLTLAARHCTRILVLSEGRIVADGSPTEVFTAGLMRDVYGVEALIEEMPGGLIVVPAGRAVTPAGPDRS
ncbi:MAG: ABC transporter ATP-binding protein [Hyphomicrobiaceae bacterium]|nr:ABC transporter ATP-binding protein [Hyphomicrobiaceae bacterium]